ncbi:MAG: chemotaxis protein CheW [Acidobacteria bacterium]|nr:chemotaxis protein CheW [Acidobacteriota bacterium]
MRAFSSGVVRRLVRCVAGSETFCIDHQWLDSIQVIENLYPSRSADGSIGWIRRFDEKVPVFRLADQIYGGAGRGPSRQGVIMVLKRNDRKWALLVDKVVGAVEIPSEQVFPLPPIVGDTTHGTFPSVIVEEQGLTLCLAPDRVVPSEISGPQALRTAAWARPTSGVRSAIARREGLAASAPAENTPRHKAAQIISFTLEYQKPLKPQVRFAVSAGQALEIVSDPPLISVPNSPSFVIGLANWRSLPVPVVDLAAWFGLSPAPYRPGCRLLLCRGASSGLREAGVLAVPAVDDIRKIDLPFDCKPWTEPVGWNPSLALGIYQAEKAMLVVPDLDAILSFQAATSGYAM